MTKLTRREETWGELGPAMKMLPNARWRAFVEFYLLETVSNGAKDNYGAKARAARRAGFGKPTSTTRVMAHLAWKLMRDERIVAAIAEESRKLLRAGAPEAVKAVLQGVRNPDHKDHARFVSMVLDRADPVTSHSVIDVTHKILDPDQEALEELRAMRKLGLPREKLLELFGGNGLARLEKLEAADIDRRADSARVIEGEAIEEEMADGQ
jgi:hypothetical protein